MSDWYNATSWGVIDYPEPPAEPPRPVCPVCGDECETWYMKRGEIIGCDQCIQSTAAETERDE